jgi:TDG/mug DNA glycosylase family protein
MLPDILRPGLRLVICGTAAGTVSAARGHYYAGPGNEFWQLLHDSGLVSARLRPEQDTELLQYGIGLTDLVKGTAQSNDRGLRRRYDVANLTSKIESVAPAWLALHGKEAGKAVARDIGRAAPGLGMQDWRVSGANTFVLPNASGANRGGPYDGRATRLEWWNELARLLLAERA